GDLIDRLRRAGHRIDTRQYLMAHELLLEFGALGVPLLEDAGRLTTHLGPVFCTSAEEQSQFGGHVLAWLGRESTQEQRTQPPKALLPRVAPERFFSAERL